MKTKIMLPLVAIATLFATAIFAQSNTTFGIRGGVNFYNLTGKNAAGNDIENKLKTGFNLGLNAEIPVGIDFYLQPGLLFSTKGAKAEGSGDNKINLSYLELPVNFLYKPTLGMGKLLLGFGPYAGYAIDGNYDFGGNKEDIDFGGPGEFKRFDAGANFLFGYETASKVSVQLNAGLGLLNIVDNSSEDETKIKNTGFGVSLGYRF